MVMNGQNHDDNNVTDFARAVLCALLISMIFAYLLSGEDVAYSVSRNNHLGILDLLKKSLACRKAHVWYIVQWLVFYFWYLIDDYVLGNSPEQKERGKKYLGILAVGWFALFWQAFTIWNLRLSACLGILGLGMLSFFVWLEKSQLMLVILFENGLMLVGMLLCLFSVNSYISFSQMLILMFPILKLCGLALGRPEMKKS